MPSGVKHGAGGYRVQARMRAPLELTRGHGQRYDSDTCSEPYSYCCWPTLSIKVGVIVAAPASNAKFYERTKLMGGVAGNIMSAKLRQCIWEG